MWLCNVILFLLAHTVDQWEDADSTGHVLWWGQKSSQQVAETSGLHGRAGLQQRLARQNW